MYTGLEVTAMVILNPFLKRTFQYVGPLGNIVSYIEPITTLVDHSTKFTPSRNFTFQYVG